MHQLAPASQAELEEFCRRLGNNAAAHLREAVERVCVDPSGQREPRHNFTQKFRNVHQFKKNVPKNVTVWEFKTSQCRAVFVREDVELGDKIVTLVAFLPIKGTRFFTLDECPWHRKG